jgi:hypothetical protein
MCGHLVIIEISNNVHITVEMDIFQPENTYILSLMISFEKKDVKETVTLEIQLKTIFQQLIFPKN